MRAISSILGDMRDGGMKTDLITTAFVASYEHGVMDQSIFYATVRGADLREGYIAHAATEFGDLIMQLRVMAELMGLDWPTLVDMGEAKVYERLNEFANKIRPRPDVELANGGAAPIQKQSSAYRYRNEGD